MCFVRCCQTQSGNAFLVHGALGHFFCVNGCFLCEHFYVVVGSTILPQVVKKGIVAKTIEAIVALLVEATFNGCSTLLMWLPSLA